MPITVAISEHSQALFARDDAELLASLETAAAEAVAAGKLGIAVLTAPNGNDMTFVVGGNETVLGFTYGHGQPPYFVSVGVETSQAPLLVAYYLLGHHTEFSRDEVIPLELGTRAALEFLATSELPECVRWREV